MGYGGIAAVLVAMLAALTVLPALAACCSARGSTPAGCPGAGTARSPVDDDHGGVGPPRPRRDAPPGRGDRRRRSVALLALASPFLGAKWGSVDERVLPADAPAHVARREAQRRVRRRRRSTRQPAARRAPTRPTVAAYTAEVEAVDGVTPYSRWRTGRATARCCARSGTATARPRRPRTSSSDLRDVEPRRRATALVGGTTARHRRPARLGRRHLPWMGLIVVGVMLVLLFLAFGSVVLPVKAVLMNAFSISASFGVVTWIFQDGHLAGPARLRARTGYLDATQPILMLAILFGLSMDYEVFLLSRVREEWDRTGDNDLAVATGVQRTGRIITSAALLLAVVIGAFATQRHRVHQDDRHRHAGRPAHRRDPGPGPAGAGDDEAARPLELVGARPAAPLVGAARLARGGATPRRRRLPEPQRDPVESRPDPPVIGCSATTGGRRSCEWSSRWHRRWGGEPRSCSSERKRLRRAVRRGDHRGDAEDMKALESLRLKGDVTTDGEQIVDRHADEHRRRLPGHLRLREATPSSSAVDGQPGSGPTRRSGGPRRTARPDHRRRRRQVGGAAADDSDSPVLRPRRAARRVRRRRAPRQGHREGRDRRGRRRGRPSSSGRDRRGRPDEA